MYKQIRKSSYQFDNPRAKKFSRLFVQARVLIVDSFQSLHSRFKIVLFKMCDNVLIIQKGIETY